MAPLIITVILVCGFGTPRITTNRVFTMPDKRLVFLLLCCNAWVSFCCPGVPFGSCGIHGRLAAGYHSVCDQSIQGQAIRMAFS